MHHQQRDWLKELFTVGDDEFFQRCVTELRLQKFWSDVLLSKVTQSSQKVCPEFTAKQYSLQMKTMPNLWHNGLSLKINIQCIINNRLY